MHILIGEIKWTWNHLPAKPQRSMSLALSQFKTPSEAKYTKKFSPFLQYKIPKFINKIKFFV